MLTEIPKGMKAFQQQVESTLWTARGQYVPDALIAPDGPLWPALRALGIMAIDESVPTWTPREVLGDWGITGPLADACLAAAGVSE